MVVYVAFGPWEGRPGGGGGKGGAHCPVTISAICVGGHLGEGWQCIKYLDL